jgi:3',5'-nucleoside bisphosphate phosphatase
VINADLHCHTRASDGSLEPASLLEIARARGIRLFAVTDHDTTENVASARRHAFARGVQFVSGVEMSAQWQDTAIHIVGLNIDVECTALQTTLANTRQLRRDRAQAMGEDLELSGIITPLKGALEFATNPNLISRTHFARYLVASGQAGSMGEVFSRYMKPGKPGYVAAAWQPMEDCIARIHDAGGVAVLAHAARYECAAGGGLEALIGDFKTAGGDALEVVCAGHSPADWANFAALCRKYDLLASTGSDFHSNGESRVRIGDLPRLSPSLAPVWRDWSHLQFH